MDLVLEPTRQQPEPIAVIGMGCRLPGEVDSPADFWALLSEGRDVITEVPADRWDQQLHYHSDPRHPMTQHVSRGGFVSDIDQFDSKLFGISPREATCMDPQQRMLLEVAWRAVEDSAQPFDSIRGRAVGVFVGISSGDYAALLWASEQRWLTPDNDPFILAGNTGCIAANRLSYVFDWRGPSFAIDTACSSSLVAVHQACQSLHRGESELALAGGVQALIHPGLQSTFCKAGLLSPIGRCSSFDASADGYVRSEGAGAVLLKPLQAALRDGNPIHAVIRGTAVNSDGRTPGMAAPSEKAQSACMRQAYEQAGLEPSDCLYIEAHGTGTRQGDPIELRALGNVLADGRSPGNPCRVGSVKSNLGHSQTAAGITGLIKAVLCLRHRQLPPSLHFKVPNSSVDLAALRLQVQTKLEPFPELVSQPVLGVSSFGFGGTNAHVLLTSPAEGGLQNSDLEPQPGPWLLILSARTEEALQILRGEMAAWLRENPSADLPDIAATSFWGRSRFRHALACRGSTSASWLSQLEGAQPLVWQGVIDGDLPLSLEELIDGCCWPDQHRWLPLPGHPFLKHRFWWPRDEVGQVVEGASLWLDHLDLGHRRSAEPGRLAWQLVDLPGDRRHLQATISAATEADLRDHRIRGQMVFPAAGHLALALDWLWHSGSGPGIWHRIHL